MVKGKYCHSRRTAHGCARCDARALKPDATIEAQIEAAWCALIDTGRARRFVLTSAGKLRYGPNEPGEEIGTFTPAISLADFRAEVFHVYAQLRVATHGHR